MNSLDGESGETSNPRKKSLRLRINRTPSSVSGIKNLDYLGFFSMNSNYEFRDDLSQLRYLTLPRNPNFEFDLKINSDKIIRKKISAKELKLDLILKWLISHRQELVNSEKRLLGDFVTFRGVLSQVMCTPYEKFEGWIICATKLKGTIYLCKYDTPEKIKAEESRTSKEKEMGDWGFKFEQFLLSEHPGSLPNVNEPNNQNEEFACIFRSTIGPYNMLYAAEMDGMKLSKKGRNSTAIGDDSKRLKGMLKCGDAEFVELKTSADPTINNWEWKKICRFKSNKWWAQSYLVGITELFCGYRNGEGVVRKLQKFLVNKLPQLGRGFWNPDVCLQYLIDFLNLVAEQVSSECDEQLWMFTWNPKTCRDSIQVELCDQNSPYFFLHKWAIDELTLYKRKNEETSEGPSSSKKK